MKFFDIFVIFVLCNAGLSLAVDPYEAGVGTTYRAPGDILNLVAHIPILKFFEPFIAAIGPIIGAIEENTVVKALFPVLQNIADETSVFPVPKTHLPLKKEEKVALLMLKPLFSFFLSTPPLNIFLFFLRPILEPIVTPLKVLIYEILRIGFNLILKAFKFPKIST